MAQALEYTGFENEGAPLGEQAPTRPRSRRRIRFGGYRKVDFLSSVLFSIPTATLLLLVSLPFFVIVPLVILIQDGRPVFYKGTRLGQNKKPFKMYKFRTLVKDAEKRVGGKLLSSKDRLETPSGRILRETRVDELPQLINVIRGEMGLVGPRPERPAVYETQCKDIPGYDKRFAVKPGIIGYSQLFTPHSTPKKARALLDNYYVRRRQKWHVDIVFFVLAITWLAQRAMIKSAVFWRDLLQVATRQGNLHELRASERIRPPSTQVHISFKGEEERFHAGEIDDICDEGLVFLWDEELPRKEIEIQLKIEGHFPARRGIKRKTAYCTGKIHRVWTQPDGRKRHVVLYQPKRTLDLFLIHQYFLHKSIV